MRRKFVQFLSFPLVAGAAVAAAMLSPTAAQAATEDKSGPDITISANARVRMEALDGEFRPAATDHELFVSSRLNVLAEADFGAVAVGGELRDARALSIDDGSAARGTSINTLEPLQAWIAFDADHLAGGKARLKVGRFSQKIGSGRLVGASNFGNNTNTFAGAQLQWSAGDTRFTGFWTRPFDTLPSAVAEVQDNKVELDRISRTTTFFGGSLSQAKLVAGATGEVYVYRLAEHDDTDAPTANRKLVTFGGRLFSKQAANTLDFDVEGAAQVGTIRATTAAADTTDLLVRAGFAHAETGWTFASAWRPRISAEFDYASGDRRDARHYGRFDMLYGTRRSVFGPTSIYGPLSWNNLVSPGLRLSAQPSPRLDGFAGVRGVWLDSATDSLAKTGVRDKSGRSGHYAGTQLEARTGYWLVKRRLRLEIGGAVLLKGRFLEDAPNAPATGDTHYGYMDLTASF
ncbi:MAG: alginate export family protein [Sphingomonas sp.]